MIKYRITIFLPFINHINAKKMLNKTSFRILRYVFTLNYLFIDADRQTRGKQRGLDHI